MRPAAWKFVKTVGLIGATLGGLLAMISGAVRAIAWASHTIGSLPVAVAGAFLLGVIVTHSLHRSLAAGREGPKTLTAGSQDGAAARPTATL